MIYSNKMEYSGYWKDDKQHGMGDLSTYFENQEVHVKGEFN